MQKKLSIAFLWHMHQPVYQETPQGVFLMPWVRLHTVKDYLDMLLIMDNFENLKLNFNFVPILISALQKYAYNGAHDIHSQITVKPVEELTDDDKLFILNNFFDANFANMILHHEYYAELYQKRCASEDININSFTDQEYSDILAWFNLAWFDPYWKREYSDLGYYAEKTRGFTLDERKRIIEIQRDIIKRVLPSYKKYQDEGRIEVITSPYYHPIVPLLLNKEHFKDDLKEDVSAQITLGVEKYEEAFGRRPKGIWPPEHSISADTLKLFSQNGFKWTVSDEGILAETLKKEFVRDYKGYPEAPYDLCSVYKFQDEKDEIAVIFRDSVLANLINFEYSHQDSIAAANDLYERIKITQSKLKQSPGSHDLLTIALDGENCWESYANDGEIFLRTLYNLIEKDPSLETVLISDYVEKTRHKKLSTIHPGSWINRDFKLWINEPTKDMAWNYMLQARDDLKEFEKETDNEALKLTARKELYIAQGSDWYWWLGEPNDSGQDEVFDYLFRRRLSNIYQLYNKPVPDYLKVPLIKEV